jgi:hypothetical protein
MFYELLFRFLLLPSTVLMVLHLYVWFPIVFATGIFLGVELYSIWFIVVVAISSLPLLIELFKTQLSQWIRCRDLRTKQFKLYQKYIREHLSGS